jgi:hypothetical protein
VVRRGRDGWEGVVSPAHVGGGGGGAGFQGEKLKFGVAVPRTMAQKAFSHMPPTLVVAFRVCCVAVGLACATVKAAEPKQHPLVGATRAQIVARFGEPRSQIMTGNREVLFFDRERFELVNNVVTFVEPLAGEASGPATLAVRPGVRNAGESVAPAEAAPVPPVRAGAERLAIKTVRPRGTAATDSENVTKDPALVPPTAPAAEAAPAPKKKEAPPSPVSKGTGSERAATTAPAVEKKSILTRRALSASDVNFEAPWFTTQSLVVIAVAVFGWTGYFLWRYRQRAAEAATPAGKRRKVARSRVARTREVPIKVAEEKLVQTQAPQTEVAPGAVATSTAGTHFTAEVLARLDGKRFVPLVAAYYNRTGVVATPTGADPSAAVQIRISWKGEPRPFANVQCIAQPSGPIDVRPLKKLLGVLAAEDIRRGYVVTSGEFTVEAQNFAEENQLTLMPGDALAEKLNALPESVRKELRRETVGEAAGSA